MKADSELFNELDDIAFEYERMTSVVTALQALVTEYPIDIVGLPENTIQYSLYEVELRMKDINEKLKNVVSAVMNLEREGGEQ